MSREGIALLETLILVTLLLGFAAMAHIAVFRHGSKKLRELESTRLRYDGGKLWSE